VEIDRGGAINTITPHNTTSQKATGMVVSSFLVEVQRRLLRRRWKNGEKKYPGALREYDRHPDLGSTPGLNAKLNILVFGK
jgi:hypothetical protein